MNTIKIITLIICVLVLNNTLSAQQSDYQIKEQFESTYSDLKQKINKAQSISDIDSIMNEIEALENTYDAHADMISNAVYPSTYQSKISDLIISSKSIEQKLLVIENQDEELSKLSRDASNFYIELTKLHRRSDSLYNELNASEANELKLAELINNYRKSVEERDKFTLNIIDSLFITYSGLAESKINELSYSKVSGSINDGENPLAVIKMILVRNIELLKASSASLSTEDLLRIYALQVKVNEGWNMVGNNLITIYGGNNKEQWNNEIETNLEKWKASVSLSMWNSLATYLKGRNINLGAFDNNSSFFNALDTYVTNSIQNKENVDLNTFKEFWSNKVMLEWNTYLIESEVLTTAQLATIDAKVDNWNMQNNPIPTWIYIALAIFIFIIIGLILALIFK